MVITKFNLFENYSEAEYIVCFPSGEIIYTKDSDLDYLTARGMIYRNKKNPEYFISPDCYRDKIIQYIEDFRGPVFAINRLTIAKFLEDCGVLNDQYKILDDLSIDLLGPIDMSHKKLEKIPFKFNRCTSDFNCSNNELKTLTNAPLSVHGNFNCSFNNLKTLENGPKMVSRVYNCSNNELISLKGSPSKLKFFDCSNNLLTNLSYAPKVSDSFNMENNNFPIKNNSISN